MSGQEFLSPVELAEKLGFPLKTIRKWTTERRIPGMVKIGGRWRYRVMDIEHRLNSGEFLLPT